MSTYIFYTREGYTEGPNGKRVENCQLLGEAEGETAKEALENLLNENPWIADSGFEVGAGKIIARILSEKARYLL